jgi:hypothetical protein
MKLSANMIIALEEAPEGRQFSGDRRTLNALAARRLVRPLRFQNEWSTRLTSKGRVTKKNLHSLTNRQLLDIFGESPRLLEYCK